ncbi:phosphotransferase family enzyme [Kitasatospora sp. SolWspMP-SS2h]|uniref:phosphotransferase n=1 Tax=Kitasatospora sp. SolWspMP-SS2h TaxID=1305729 RepID=UPI000DB98D2F|nr:phosphotransferase [Kitasatospora sp. SolWspMP-SS2h]RAJ38665.1 phosphotransferase family enzyme [Kitasatospora sp. SolWspMP-SS2h]
MSETTGGPVGAGAAGAPGAPGAPGELLGTGRTADVFALPDGRVLRRYRAGADAWADARGEADLMAHLARHGYPVPAAWPGERSTDLLMERLDGPTMARAVTTGALAPDAAGRMLADLLRRLHAVPPRTAARPGDRVLHLDLHPENVLLTPRGPVVIDWATATEGDPGLDTAMSAVVLAQALLGMPAHTAAAPAVLVPLLRGLPPLADHHLTAARARRAADPVLDAADHGRLDAAVALVRACAAKAAADA